MGIERIFRKIDKKFITDDADEFGTICYEVEASRYATDEPYKMGANLRIQDCYHTINLDFYVGNKPHKYEKRLEKLDVLIETLQEMKDELKAGYEMMETKNKDVVVDPNKKPVSAMSIVNELKDE